MRFAVGDQPSQMLKSGHQIRDSKVTLRRYMEDNPEPGWLLSQRHVHLRLELRILVVGLERLLIIYKHKV
jgi:hypothetical protein